MAETLIWTGSSSPLKNLSTFFVSTAAVAGVVAASGVDVVAQMDDFGVMIGGILTVLVFWNVWKWLQVRSRIYELTTERILVTRGLLDKQTEFMELHRIRDLQIHQSWLDRFLGLQSLHLLTSDFRTPEIVIDSAPAQLKLPDRLRLQVEACRSQKGAPDGELELDLIHIQ